MMDLQAKSKEMQQKHPMAFWTLVLAMLAPLVVGITAAGMLLKHLFPAPSQLLILMCAVLLILTIAPLMLLGAFGWLLMARCCVPRPVAKIFFVHPGFGILFRISEWMFICVYGKDDV